MFWMDIDSHRYCYVDVDIREDNMIGDTQEGLMERHIRFAKGDNYEPMIHRSLINAENDKIEYDMVSEYYDCTKSTSTGEKLG